MRQTAMPTIEAQRFCSVFDCREQMAFNIDSFDLCFKHGAMEMERKMNQKTFVDRAKQIAMDFLK
jgi:hypothetical protein